MLLPLSGMTTFLSAKPSGVGLAKGGGDVAAFSPTRCLTAREDTMRTPLIIALTLGAVAAWAQRPTIGAPEVRGLAVPREMISVADFQSALAAMTEAHFNTLMIDLAHRNQERVPEMCDQAHTDGHDVWGWTDAPAGDLRATGARRLAAALASAERIDAAVLAPTVDLASFREAAPGLRLIGLLGDAPSPEPQALQWAREGEVDAVLLRVHADRATDEITAAQSQLPPHFPLLTFAAWENVDQVSAVIGAMRGRPCVGAIFHAPEAVVDDDFAALRAGLFERPAFPPERDWHAASVAALALAAVAEDVPPALALRLATSAREMGARRLSDLRAHQLLDHIIQDLPPDSPTRRELELSRLCLRRYLGTRGR